MTSPSSKQTCHLRQTVSITGLGLDEFLDQVNMIPEITALFTRAVSEEKIGPNAIIGELEDLTTLNASNRYFTLRKEAQTATELRFHEDIDPYGNLTKLLGSTLVHIEENNLSYYERVNSIQTGDARYF